MKLPDERAIVQRWAEMWVLFAVVPLLAVYFEQKRFMFGILWVAVVYAIYWLRRYGVSVKGEWNTEAVTWCAMWPILRRFAFCAVLLTGCTLVLVPEKLLSLPRERPQVWLMVMVFYPLLSVLPQEILFRSFFFRRYSGLLHWRHSLILLSATAFGIAHIVLNNWVAVILSTVGGVIFASTYARHRSLALVCIEHALYGCFVFTIGLGWYFFSGANHHF